MRRCCHVALQCASHHQRQWGHALEGQEHNILGRKVVI